MSLVKEADPEINSRWFIRSTLATFYEFTLLLPKMQSYFV